MGQNSSPGRAKVDGRTVVAACWFCSPPKFGTVSSVKSGRFVRSGHPRKGVVQNWGSGGNSGWRA